MASVFLSYDREDSDRARAIATALEKTGHSVWWDRQIKGGAQYSKVIEQALEEADAVVVLWSAKAVESAWVRDEAAAGRDTGRLVPAALDATAPPLGFRQYQTIDLTGGKQRRANLAALNDAISAVGSAERAPEAPRAPPVSKSRSWRGWVIAAALALTLPLALWLWRPWAKEDVTLVAIGPAQGDRASRDLARDLTVKLASLPTAQSGSMRLVSSDPESAQSPDLLLEVANAAAGRMSRASLVLKASKDQSILWSKDFKLPSTSLADLNQQIAFTTARVLGCAVEAMQPRERLRLQTLKVYLNGCAQLAEIASADPGPVIPMFITVVRDAPRFKAAWGKLLLAESELVGPSFVDGESNAQTANALREHIRDARRVDPNMAEALLAEAALVPPRDISGAVRLIERAAQQSPDNPAVVAHRAGVLARVGRSREAVELAQRAAELDPLSPTALNGFISTLAYAGRVETAQRELSQAERLWSGTAALRDAQYRFHFRYGDPNAALAMEESDTAGGTPRLYLNTKLQPTEENVAKLLKHVKGRLAHMRNPSAGLGFAIQTYGEFGDKEEVIRLLLNWPRRDDLGAIAELFFRPHLRQVRRDPRFMEIANRAGLLDYWRASGKWPDFCFDDDQPYDCKAEAAKTGA